LLDHWEIGEEESWRQATNLPDRDLSIFQIGLRWMERHLVNCLPISVQLRKTCAFILYARMPYKHGAIAELLGEIKS
jgi:hypothetical protein